MAVILAIIDRDRLPPLGPLVESLEARIGGVLPGGLLGNRQVTWMARDKGTFVGGWARDGQVLPVDTSSETTILGSGYWSAPPPSLSVALSSGSGEGLVSLVAGGPRHVTARASVSAVEPLFLAKSERRIALSNRAMVASVAARGGVEIHEDSLPEYVSAGFGLSEKTPFAGVEWVDAGTHLTIYRRRFGRGFEEERTRPIRPDLPPMDADDAGRLVAEALVGAVRPLMGSDINLGLTGGKDSRLIAAALRCAEVPFSTYTFGDDQHPDVVVASEVASVLGVPHVVRSRGVPAGDAEVKRITVDPLSRAAHAVVLGEGMVSAYENLGVASPAFDASPTLNGVGGELLRGGYAHYAPDVSPEGAQRFLVRGFNRHPGILTPEARSRLDLLLRPWIEYACRSPKEALDRFYRDYRVGRWGAASRSAYSLNAWLVQPLLDSSVVRESAVSSIDDRLNEWLIFKMLRELSPALASWRFAGERWRFEVGGPHPGLAGWEHREPVRLESEAPTGPAYNWRVHYGTEVQQHFAEVVLDPARSADLFRVLDRASVERILTAESPQAQHLSWHLYTISVLLSGVWKDLASASHPITMEVPA